MEIRCLGFCGAAAAGYALGVVSLLWAAKAAYRRAKPRQVDAPRASLGDRYPSRRGVTVDEEMRAREAGRRRMLKKVAERNAKRHRL